MKKQIFEYKGFRIGDRFKVSGRSKYWDSALNPNSPLMIKYPHTGIILEMEMDMNSNGGVISVAMTDGKYGWSLDDLIKCKKITSIRDERKLKLKTLLSKNIFVNL
jgi:hypothetical protein